MLTSLILKANILPAMKGPKYGELKILFFEAKRLFGSQLKIRQLSTIGCCEGLSDNIFAHSWTPD